MEWLQTHWIALAGIAALGYLIDRFLETLATIEPSSDQSEPALMGLVELSTRFTPPPT